MIDYGYEAGVRGSAPTLLPTELGLTSPGDRATLVMAVHPSCPCTRASLDVLERIGAVGRERVTIIILLAELEGIESAAQEGALARRVRRLIDVSTLPDPGGRLAESMGLKTSGEVVYYDPAGALRYQGGLTAARGSALPGSGYDSILDQLSGTGSELRLGPAFGCQIHGSARSW